jgi:hypothetical protein
VTTTKPEQEQLKMNATTTPETAPTPIAIEDKLALAVSAARAAHPKRRLYACDSPAGILVLGSPNKASYAAYRTLVLSDEPIDKANAANTLLIACAVDPDPRGMALLLEDYVALAQNADVVTAIAKAIGSIKDDTAKK